jgi:hypothetical protein
MTMRALEIFVEAFGKLPVEALACLVSLAGLAVAAFAIHFANSVIKQKERR